MGAAILITLGVLFLLQQFYEVSFWQTSWPVLLLVVGIMMLVARTASTEGHIQPYWMGGPAAPGTAPVQGDPWAGGGSGGSSAGTQSSSAPGGTSSSGTSGSGESEVHS
jgi:hypothetical protein